MGLVWESLCCWRDLKVMLCNGSRNSGVVLLIDGTREV